MADITPTVFYLYLIFDLKYDTEKIDINNLVNIS